MARQHSQTANGKVMLTVHVAQEIADKLDRYQKAISAGRWRRADRITKSAIVEDALRLYFSNRPEDDW
jgi:hypothetical protein